MYRKDHMNRRFAFHMLVVLLMVGCNENNVEVQPSTDDVLRQAILGSWTPGSPSRIRYLQDGTFIDTTVLWRMEGQPPDTLTIIRSGRYNIDDGILYHSFVHTINHTSSGRPWAWGGDDHPVELTVIGDTLWGKNVTVYSKLEGSPNDLAGTWTTVMWTTNAADSSFVPVYEGRAQYTYTFFPDSLRVHVQSEWLDVNTCSPQDLWTSYIYDPPLLRIGTGAPDEVRVTFNNRKMRWYRDFWTYRYTRLR